MTHHDRTQVDSYPSPEHELRAALLPLRNALVLSGALVLGLAASGFGV